MSTEVIVAVIGALAIVVSAAFALWQARMTNRHENDAKAAEGRAQAEATARDDIARARRDADIRVAAAYDEAQEQQERLNRLVTQERDTLAEQVSRLTDQVERLTQQVHDLTAELAQVRQERQQHGPQA